MICKICGLSLKAINNSHLRKHDTTLEEYRKRFPKAECGQVYTPLTEEQREKIRVAARNRKKSKEEKRKIGLKSKGRVHSEETRKKISKGQKGRKAWNKGMTGIFSHSEEYKDKMRLQQCQLISKRKGKRTSIEIKVRNLLNTLKIAFEEQKVMHDRFTVDFYIPDFDTVIECNGDYWHSREDVKARDKRKMNYLTKCGHSILVLWESEINEDIKKCGEKIIDVCR